MTYLIECIYALCPGAVFRLSPSDLTSLQEGTEESISVNDFVFHRTNLPNEEQLMSFLRSHPDSSGLAWPRIGFCLSLWRGKGNRFRKITGLSQGFSAPVPPLMVISWREVRSLKAFLKPLNLLLFFLVASTGSGCGTRLALGASWLPSQKISWG